ncbi:MAG: hypothetical protein LBJ10_08855, partial [Clostridiales bacterium]|nr:hypothetical protein [Clostridiales bacterium]
MKKNDSVLFTPLRIGGVTMKNRFEAAPGLPQSEQSLRNLIFTAERAAGGSGLVCLGEAVVHARTGYCHKNNITLDDEDNATTLMELADTIRRYGALSSVQLIHSGRRANPSHLVGGDRVYGPSAGDGVYGNKVYELTEELIEEIVEAFAHGAMLARYSGLDMVMVHAAHGWLPHQFLSPLNNRRGDRFGGSIENRARFLLMIIDRIKRACGNDYPVDVRISGAELYEGGYGVDDMVELAKLIDGKADMIHVSASTFHNRDGMVRLYPSQYAEHGLNVEYAAKIKAAVGIPVAVVGAMD